MIAGNAEIIDMQPRHAFAQQIHRRADHHAHHGAKQDLSQFGVAQARCAAFRTAGARRQSEGKSTRCQR